MIGLNRELAPVSERAWKQIDGEARDVLKTHLAARRLADFEGPLGWEYSAIDLGGVDTLEGPVPDGALVRVRRVRPLIELRVPFEIPRAELERIDRGARRIELEPLAEAAKLFAAAEDTALFEGYADAGIPGLRADAESGPVALPEDASDIPDAVAEALEHLRRAGVGGPYAMALGPDPYAALEGSARDGYPVLRHVQRLIEGPVVWAPTLEAGLVTSLRGGDYKIVCGRDASIGYLDHDPKVVRLYLEESLSAELTGPEAVVPLVASEPGK